MPLPELNLDDRRFEDIVLEAKRRIPGYTPDWTDHNDSDPGMALVQLFAWMSEMIIYRLNKVPEKNYRKFLELIGVSLKPATPAGTDLTFTLSDGAPVDMVHNIPAGTRVALSDAVEGGPVVFETDDNLGAVAARIVKLRNAGRSGENSLERSPEVNGQPFYPFSLNPGEGQAFEIAFDRALPAEMDVKLTVHVPPLDLGEGGSVRSEIEPSVSGEEDDLPPGSGELQERRAPVELNWSWRLEGDTAWRPLSGVKDSSAGFLRSGAVIFKGPKIPAGAKPADKEKPFLWIRCEIIALLDNGYETAPRIERVLLNTVHASQATHVVSELLGASSGLPAQVFKLATRPVLASTLKVVVKEGTLGEKEWKAVPRLSDHGREARVFVLNPATGELTFGDGRHGMIPPVDPLPDSRGFYDNITASYRWGGGARGNAGAGKITGLESAVAYVESVTNASPATGGSDEEKIEDAQRRAPEFIRSRSRAVTAGDFEHLARETPGAQIRRAKALPNHHPDVEPPPSPGSETITKFPVPGVVTVIVIPAARAGQDYSVPGKETLDLVGAWLNRHRLVTTQIFVRGPRYRPVKVVAKVQVARNANSAEVRDKLQKKLLEYFHPITGGDDGTGWEFGGTIFFTKVVRRMFEVPGVEKIPTESLKIHLGHVPQASCRDIQLAPDELTYSTEHWLEVGYSL